MKRLAVIGAGNWGTALAVMAARKGHEVTLWSRNAEVVAGITASRVNHLYLEGVTIPDGVTATDEIGQAVTNSDLIILAAPSHAMRDLLKQIASSIPDNAILISATKGIEIASGQRMSQVVNDVLGGSFPNRFVCLSGPSFADEVVAGYPTAIVAASIGSTERETVQKELSFANLRIYSNDDLVGTELGGSIKNIMAIAAGMVAGLGFGTNTVAALITRGLAEMTRLALRQGARLETMMGLAGLGDLVLTCTGALSRNRRVGFELGKGTPIDKITSSMRGVAEGIKTTAAVHNLAMRLGVEMPITEQVRAVLYDNKSAKDAASELMARPLRDEA